MIPPFLLRQLFEGHWCKLSSADVLHYSVLESYIIHVRITEDAAYPSVIPAPDSPAENKKARVIIVAVRNSGLVRLHKARENPDGSFSIGKSWSLNDLSAIESYSAPRPTDKMMEERIQYSGRLGFTVTIIKPYFWQGDTPREKEYFIASLIKIYRKFTGGRIPNLIGFDARETQQVIDLPAQEAGKTPPAPSAPEGSQSQTANDGPRGYAPATARTPPEPLPPGNYRSSVDTAQSNNPQSYGLGVSMQGRVSSESVGRGNDGRVLMAGQPPGQPQQRPSISSLGDSARFDRGSDEARSRQGSRQGSRVEQLAVNGYPDKSGGSPERIGAPRRPESPYSESLHSGAGERYGRNRSAQGSPSQRDPSSASGRPSISEGQADLPERMRQPSQTSLVNAGQTRVDDGERAPSREERLLRNGAKTSLDSMRSSSEALRPPPPRPGKTPVDDDHLRRGVPDTPDTVSVMSERSDRATPPLTASTVPTAPTPPPVPPPEPREKEQPEEVYRPGLGPMIKKKSNRDVATTFRIAATAYGAFKPRGFGTGSESDPKSSQEPDGITAVVPAPGLRRPASPAPPPPPIPESSVVDQARGLSSDQRPDQSSASVASEPGPLPLQPIDNSSSSIRPPSTSPRPAPHSSAPPSPQPPPQSTPPPPPIPARQRQKTLQFERTARLVSSSLGISPSLLDERGSEINSILHEFHWGDHQKSSKGTNHGTQNRHDQKIESLENDLRREIARVEAGSWLWHLDQNKDDRVEQVEGLLDQVIAECDELDGMLGLWKVELNVRISLPIHSSLSSYFTVTF